MPQDREFVITAGRGTLQYWREVWEYRDLFFYLSWRDILVRYKQTAVGVAWSVLRPLLTMVIFTFVFGVLARLPSEGTPYALFVLTALIPWQLFSTAIGECSNSLIANSNLLTKVYFPRVIIPASAMAGTMLDAAISFVLLLMLAVWYGVTPGWQILALPLFLGLVIALSFGLGIWFAALNARYRDFRYVVPFIIQVGLYASPVGFSSGVVPERWRTVYALNPMVGIIEGFRWALLGGRTAVDFVAVGFSAAIAIALLTAGTLYFRATERVLADVI